MKIVGVDEAGRGPLAGPVCVGAISIPPNIKHSVFNVWVKHSVFNVGGEGGMKDSKKLSEMQREKIFKKLVELRKKGEINFAFAMVSAKGIDKMGISRATALAVARALVKLSLNPRNSEILLDGLLMAPKIFKNQKTIIKGDEKVPVIALASIIAKVKRDKKMVRLSKKYPRYEFEVHKGYGTKLHVRRIKKYGLAEIHRKSFCKNLDISVRPQVLIPKVGSFRK